MKDRKTYKTLTFCSLILPINRWYLGNAKGAFWRSVSANYFFLGWIGDMLYMDKTFDEAMAKRGFANTSVRNEQGR